MKFHICVIEPSTFKYGYYNDETIRLVSGTLQDLGHPCSVERNTLKPHRTNLLFGAHLLGSLGELHALIQCGIDYVVFQSELLTTMSTPDMAMSVFLERLYWPLLRGARAVWDPCSLNLATMRQHHIHGEHVQLGYNRRLEDISHQGFKDIDFLLYGSFTPRRQQLCETLMQRGYRVHVAHDVRPVFRNDLLSRAKVTLAPHNEHRTPRMPWSRLNYHLHNGITTVVEACPDETSWPPVFDSAPSGTAYLQRCEEVLADPERPRRALQRLEHFRNLPFEESLAPLIQQLQTRIREGLHAGSFSLA